MEYFSYLALVEYRTKWVRIKWGPGVVWTLLCASQFSLRKKCSLITLFCTRICCKIWSSHSSCSRALLWAQRAELLGLMLESEGSTCRHVYVESWNIISPDQIYCRMNHRNTGKPISLSFYPYHWLGNLIWTSFLPLFWFLFRVDYSRRALEDLLGLLNSPFKKWFEFIT